MNTAHLDEMIQSAEDFLRMARERRRQHVVRDLECAMFYLAAAKVELRRLERRARR